MSSNNYQQRPNPQQPPNIAQNPELQQLIFRANFLKKNPTEQKPGELDALIKYIQGIASQNRALQPNALTNGHPQPQPNGTTVPSHLSNAPPPNVPPPSQSPVSFSKDQMDVLRAQISAYKYLCKGQPIPDTIQQAIQFPNNVFADLEKSMQGSTVTSKVIDSAAKVQKGTSPEVQLAPKGEDIVADISKTGPTEEELKSGIYPYNAYRHPLTHLKRNADADPALFATRLQRLLVPTAMPAGLDVHQILAERERYIEARMQQRIHELEELPATIGDGGFESGLDTGKGKENEDSKDALNSDAWSKTLIAPDTRGKLRALIELKSLRLIEKQRMMRAQVAERLVHGTLLPLNRVDFRRTRKPTIRDARATESLERKQRVDRERRAKYKHVQQLDIICRHGVEVKTVNLTAQDRVLKLGRSVLSFHAQTEKEEQKRIERISRERLKALKAGDEEAYIGLLDAAKDTRITHLLRQTDTFLDSLTQAVVAQQREGGLVYDPAGPLTVNETTFGAQMSSEDVPANPAQPDYYAVAHRIQEKVERQPTILVGGKLKDYQLKGLQWMISLYNNKLDGILADEMGLGKTIQTISLVTYLIEIKKQRGPYLVIVPLSTMTNWSGEFTKWAPAVNLIAYKGNPAQRRNLQQEIRTNQFQVLLTTYEYIIKDRPILSKMRWVHMIIDEGHRMKNTQSKLTQTLNTYYHSRYRLILTGTPLQNNLPELWALLNFVLPKIFNSVKSFDEWFNTPFANSGSSDKIELTEEETLLILRRLHKVLRPFLLRRLKKDVESELPDKMEKVIKVRMSALQSQLYKQMKKHKMIADGKETRGKTGGVKGLSNELMQLRKICQHPYLFESVEDKISPSNLVDDKIIRSSGKIELLARILPKFFATGHRVLIFFQMTKVMDIMEDFLKMMGWKHLRLDGGTKTEDRAQYVQLFNAPDSDIKVFILSTRAGGLGLNLQTADTVIIFDSDWNPHADLQAQDRAHRIGQTKAVLILRFITEKSVEEAMYSRALYKLDIDDKVIQAGRFDNKSTSEEQEALLKAILNADQDEDNEEAGDMNDDELNALIKRSDEEEAVFRQMDIDRERNAVETWRNAGNRGKPPAPLMQIEELPECYQNDEPFDVKESEEIIEGRGQRRRNVVSYNDGMSDDAWAMALEEGEDFDDIQDRAREKKERRATNKLLKEASASGRATPASDSDGRGRRGRKPKGKLPAADFDSTPSGGKRKRGNKAYSETPSVNGDEEEDRDQKRRRTKVADLTPAIRDKMKKAFVECQKAVLACEDGTGRKRCELFRDLPDRRDYPDYYELIKQPIAIAQIKKRNTSGQYKNVQAFRSDWKLMFSNARTYNQEGSWVYMDANEMEKVFDAAFEKHVAGSGLPGAPESNGSAAGSYDSALTPVDDDDRPPLKRPNRKTVVSDEEYLTSSDDE